VSTDLKYLVFTAMLTAALWIPYIVCPVRTNGPLQPRTMLTRSAAPGPALGAARHRPISTRSRSFAPFAALVVAAHLTGKADAMTRSGPRVLLDQAGHAWSWAGIPYSAPCCSLWDLSPRRHFLGKLFRWFGETVPVPATGLAFGEPGDEAEVCTLLEPSIASGAKPTISPRKKEWIASLRSQ